MTTILVVDDSAMDRRLAGGLLQKGGDWEVVFAVDGRDALEQMELHIPDLVLTDMQMPQMNGLQLVDAIKREFPLIPVVLMTAQGSEEIAVQALQRGAASYVPKRLLANDLPETVDRVLTAAGSHRSHTRLLRRLCRQEFTFDLENDLELIAPLVNYLQQQAAQVQSMSDSERLRLGVALEEALLNAYYHGNLELDSKLREDDHTAFYTLARRRAHEDPYQDRRILVEVRLSSAACEFTIRDDGPGFDPHQLPDPTEPANLDRASGRGVLLMRTFMDDVAWNSAGNEVRMVKRPAADAVPLAASEALP